MEVVTLHETACLTVRGLTPVIYSPGGGGT